MAALDAVSQTCLETVHKFELLSPSKTQPYQRTKGKRHQESITKANTIIKATVLKDCALKCNYSIYRQTSRSLQTPGWLGPRRNRASFGWATVSTTSDWDDSVDPGAGMLKSWVWLMLVRPGRGSNAGIRAWNWRFNTNSSSQARRPWVLPALFS